MDRLFAKKPKTEREIQNQTPMPRAQEVRPSQESSKIVVDAAFRIDEAAQSAETRARELRSKEETMPSLDDAADDAERAEIMRLDAESDAWSKIAGIFNRTSSETDADARLARIKNELVVLKHTNLDKGPEAEVMKLEAIEEVEKTLRS